MKANDPYFFQLTLPHERALVRVLVMAQRRGLDRAVMVDRLANEFTRWPERALRQVARLLADGTSLIDALEQSPRALDPTAVMALRLAMETGTFPERLESLVAADPIPDLLSHHRRREIESQLTQVVVGFLFTWFVLMFLTVFILPTIQQMYSEFGVPLPEPMSWLMAIGRSFDAAWGWLICLLLFLLAFGVIAFGRVSRLLGFRRLRPASRADVLSLLALVVQSERPLMAGVTTLSRVHPVDRFRRRLIGVARAIDGGEDGWRALAEKGLITAQDARALQLADDPLAQAWVLRRAARSGRFAADLRAGLIVHTISFLSLLLMAAIVLLAAVGMFMSIYGLVDGISFLGAVR